MADERDIDLLHVGAQCSQTLCHLVDFLPFKCQHCKKSFCQEHFKVEAHSCKEYDETKFNRVAPDCPLCNTPIAVRPGEDPNIRMDRHLETECYVMTGKSQKASSTPRCAHQTCRKILFSPIRCDKCHHQFCPAHRFPGDHACNVESARAGLPTAGSHTSNLLAKFDATKKKLTQATTTPVATKRAQSTATNVFSSTSATSATATASSSKSKAPLPFSKTDRPSSVSAFLTSHVMHATSIPATPTTDNNSTTDTTPPVRNTKTHKPPSTFNVSSFIPQPLFASA